MGLWQGLVIQMILPGPEYLKRMMWKCRNRADIFTGRWQWRGCSFGNQRLDAGSCTIAIIWPGLSLADYVSSFPGHLPSLLCLPTPSQLSLVLNIASACNYNPWLRQFTSVVLTALPLEWEPIISPLDHTNSLLPLCSHTPWSSPLQPTEPSFNTAKSD